MMFRYTVILTFYYLSANGEKISYDSYRGCPISNPEYQDYVSKNIESYCTNQIEKCDPNEGRRIDGSCNNLEQPLKGAIHNPLHRLLPPAFHKEGDNYEPRKARSGADLPPARHLRTSLIAEGKVSSQTLTQLIPFLGEFTISDILVNKDPGQYLLKKLTCCLPEGKTDPECTPIKVPVDDPVHRFSGISCFNLTRPISYQYLGCAKKDTVPSRYSTTTPQFDLSCIYGGGHLDEFNKKSRLGKIGLLKYETDEAGRIWPPSEKKVKSTFCKGNQPPAETRCHDLPDFSTNTLFPSIIFTVWFWRYHNMIAKALYEVNPCWDDEKLFNTARNIHIAIYHQILYYEMYPVLLGRKNLLKDKIISALPGFRDVYDKNKVPYLTLEYITAMRWFHTIQEANLKLYDSEGFYHKRMPVVNLTLRTGWLGVDDNIDRIAQCTFRQAAASNDYVVDPYMSESGLGPLQISADLLSTDLTRNRYYGLSPYVDYRKMCSGKVVKKWDDLNDIFYPERLELLKEIYNNVEDIDLLAGIWLEKHVKGGHVPETLYCLMKDQLYHYLISDRHWYERPNRPDAFTLDQLMEIRKASISRLMCDVGDKVTKIQRKGFLRAGPNNEIGNCDEIPKIDFSAWKDCCCDKKKNRKNICICYDENN